MQNCKSERRDKKNGADWEKPIKRAKVRNGLWCPLRRRRRSRENFIINGVSFINVRKYYSAGITENDVSCSCKRRTLHELRNRNIPIREILFRKLYLSRDNLRWASLNWRIII
jgi:hypothetical protein